MFFQDKIIGIKNNDKVLEIGPGGHPHPRSDVFLEKIFDKEEEAVAQRGFADKAEINKKIVYYKGGAFPFSDNEFDYVICSHVLEHVHEQDLAQFISEMQRVAKAGYIEYPNVFYELINFQPVHIWLMNYRQGEILLLNKNIFKSNYLHKIYREMFYGRDNYLERIFTRYRELFFTHFEWKDSFKYRVVDSFDELVSEDDYKKYKSYFALFKEGNFENFSLFKRVKRKILCLYLNFKTFYK
jgi:ubiquinone/menaquinone biosynthesis C-methylase UbiE